jgi:hypothetical protein
LFGREQVYLRASFQRYLGQVIILTAYHFMISVSYIESRRL